MNLAETIVPHVLTEAELSSIVKHISSSKLRILNKSIALFIYKYNGTRFKDLELFYIHITTASGDSILSAMSYYDYPFDFLGKESFDFIYPKFALGNSRFTYSVPERDLKNFLSKVHNHNKEVFKNYV